MDLAQQALRRKDLDAFGSLLNASHESLSKDYACSTDRLDKLCQAMRDAGALGARLTGAGFGGNAIAVCRTADVNKVMQAAQGVAKGEVFEVRPAAGLGLARW